MVRTGVTPSELTGRTWKPVSLPISTRETPSPSGDQSSSASAHSSSLSLGKASSAQDNTRATDEGVEKALGDLMLKEKEDEDEVGKQEGEEGDTREVKGETSPSTSLNAASSPESPSIKIKYPEECSSLESSGTSDHAGEYVASLLASQSTPTDTGIFPPVTQSKEPAKEEGVADEQKPAVRQFSSSSEWSESRLRHASSTSSQGSLGPPREEGPVFNLLPVEDDHLWLWVTGGGCWIKANNMPKW